ncbi:hypothetical protein VKT23_013697 [Stygiomarasmius scandens]|uniref:DNA polymerase lambda n=1 Tax=Marasmiellus scandens TaxID=2682957 RepID=A0ABR1J5Y0_9AGAR
MSRSHTSASTFFQEDDARMSIPDDNMDEYLARMMPGRNRSQNDSVRTELDAEQFTGINGSKEAGGSQRVPEDSSRDRVVANNKGGQETMNQENKLRKRKSTPIESSYMERGRREELPTSARESNNWTSSAIVSDGPPTSPVSSPIRDPASRHVSSSRKRKITDEEAEPADTKGLDSSPQNPSSTKGKGKAKAISLKETLQATVLDVDSAMHDDNSSDVAPSSPIDDFTPLKPALDLVDRVREKAKAHAERSAARQHSAKKPRPKVVKLDTGTTTKARDADQSSVTIPSSSPASIESSAVPTSAASGKGKAVVRTNSRVDRAIRAAQKKGIPVDQYGRRPTLEGYAKFAQAKAPELRAKAQEGQFLQGMKIYYFPGSMGVVSDSAASKMDLIVQHGADLVPKYDPSVVTHIIVEEKHVTETCFLRETDLRKITDIPHSIPTLTWKWIQNPLTDWVNWLKMGKKKPFQTAMGRYLDFARFSKRLDAGEDLNDRPRKRQKREDTSTVEEFSHISDFSTDVINATADDKAGADDVNTKDSRRVAPPQRQRSKVQAASSSRIPLDLQPQPLQAPSLENDPLAEFYAKALALCDEDQERWEKGNGNDPDSGIVSGSDTETDVDDDEPALVKKSKSKKFPRKRGWACDGKENPEFYKLNEDIVVKLEQLMQIHKARIGTADKFRVYGYTRAISSLRKCGYRIRNYQDAIVLPGVGTKTAQKISEIIATGDLRRLHHELSGETQIITLFTGIYGVGTVTAYDWYNKGARTLVDLTSRKYDIKLSAAQRIGIQYYDDINSRMPREEARTIFELIKPIALSIDPKLFVEIMGSYRRGKANCGDIDILITRDDSDGKTHQGVLHRLLKKLHAANILTEDLTLPDESDDFETCYRGLCHVPGVEGARRRRIDFLTTAWKSRGAALLYYTGDGLFNRSMRLKANSMGYSLNQRGLYKNVIRKPGKRTEKLDKGVIMASETEQEIFEILGVPWQEPHERAREWVFDSAK